jgi:hypothetical protein
VDVGEKQNPCKRGYIINLASNLAKSSKILHIIPHFANFWSKNACRYEKNDYLRINDSVANDYRFVAGRRIDLGQSFDRL